MEILILGGVLVILGFLMLPVAYVFNKLGKASARDRCFDLMAAFIMIGSMIAMVFAFSMGG